MVEFFTVVIVHPVITVGWFQARRQASLVAISGLRRVADDLDLSMFDGR
jgi:hypothetical protein